MKPTVLIVEDDPALVEVLRYNLESDGFKTVIAMDGEAGILALEEHCRISSYWTGCFRIFPALRSADKSGGGMKAGTTRHHVDGARRRSTVHGLNSGADDYMVKLFSLRTDGAGVCVLPGISENILNYGGIVMDRTPIGLTAMADP